MGGAGRRRARAVLAVAGIAVFAAIGVVALSNGPSLPEDWFDRPDGAEIYQRQLTSDGWPELSGIYSPDGALAKPAWRRCDPDCGEIVGREEVLQPGSTAPDTTFQLETTYRGKRTTDRAPVWRGRVTNVSPPTFTGEPSVGVTLRPRAGRWRGGWDDDRSQVGMQACRTPTGGDCRAMNEASFRSRDSGDAVLNVGYVGWYVGAIETRTSDEALQTLEAYGFPADKVSPHRAPEAAQIVAAGPLRGPVRPAARADLPAVELRPLVEVDGRDPVTVATVRCRLQCGVELIARRDGRYFGHFSGSVDGEEDIEIRPEVNARTVGPLEIETEFANFEITRTGRVAVKD